MRTRLLLALAIGVVGLALGAGVAAGLRSIEIRSPEESVKFTGRVTFNGTELTASKALICNVTLLRTLSRAIPKTSGVMGRITGVGIDQGRAEEPHCSNGSGIQTLLGIEFLQEVGRLAPRSEDRRGVILYDLSRAPALFWRLVYDSFQGTLPNIMGLSYHIENILIQWRVLETMGALYECLYRGERTLGLLDVFTGRITGDRHVLSRTIWSRESGSLLCPRSATFSGFFATPALTIALL